MFILFCFLNVGSNRIKIWRMFQLIDIFVAVQKYLSGSPTTKMQLVSQ